MVAGSCVSLPFASVDPVLIKEFAAPVVSQCECTHKSPRSSTRNLSVEVSPPATLPCPIVAYQMYLVK